MATTTNYGWTTPDDTALVKDGASAIRSLGTSIDTTTKNLNPSTTLGDIEYRSSTANTNTRLAIGSTGNVLTVAGGVPTWAAPAGGGKVLQVVSATTTTATTIATTTFTDTTITATITPTSATSRIMVLVVGQIYAERAAAQVAWGSQLVRGATVINAWPTTFNFNFSGVSNAVAAILFPITWVDSPATTSATTYKVQGRMTTTSSGATSTWQSSGGDTASTITLLEIGA